MSKQFKKTTIGLHAGTARFHTYNAGLAIDLNDTIAAIVFHHVHMNIERLVENNYVDDNGMAWLTVSKTGIMRFSRIAFLVNFIYIYIFIIVSILNNQ